jgi:steroid delta-isomerase-like uncharacterized protein
MKYNNRLAIGGIGAFLVLFLVGCPAPNDEARFEQEMREQLQDILAIWNLGNLDLVDEVYAQDVVRHSVDVEESIVGREALKEYIATIRTAYPDFHLEFDNVITRYGWVVTQWTVTGTNTGPSPDMPPTGRQVRVSGVVISKVVDGKTTEDWGYWDQAALLGQLGFTFIPPEVP